MISGRKDKLENRKLAMKLGDQVLVMDEGRILQMDTPEKILKASASDFVRDLLKTIAGSGREQSFQ